MLATIDWVIIAAYLLLSLIIGLYFRERASKSLTDFFLGGRNMSWWVAGMSMVATTFAADTPLAVTELVAQKGISGNWLWWSFLFGGMLTTFFFARLWRRSGVLTEVELIELRYSGMEASFLRGFKAVYLGLFMNVIILGWVNVALVSILQVFLDLSHEQALLYTAGAMLLTAIYSSISGLWGVAITDVVQFVIAMLGTVLLAVFVIDSPQIGGISGLQAKLGSNSPIFDFFPTINTSGSLAQTAGSAAGAFTITLGAFLSYVGVQWWASWYPGGEPGGGGYVAQRMMSAKSEKHAIYATLFFQIAHYCLRPWPWILVGLATLVLYPGLSMEDKKLGYVMAMKDFLPVGFKGMLLVAFLAAYMSTIATQLNWGASYLVNDLYRRFVKPDIEFDNEDKAQKHYVMMSKVATIVLMAVAMGVTPFINSISGAWGVLMSCGAGLGLVLILRWYWWRINAWSEIAATVTPFIVFFVCKFGLGMEETMTYFTTVGITTISWLVVTFITPPTETATLERFYEKVQPEGAWGRIAYGDSYIFENRAADVFPFNGEPKRRRSKPANMFNLFVCWISAVCMTYSILFMTGKCIFAQWTPALMWGGAALVSFIILRVFISRTNILS
ncbi:MAG: sodium:solute symporter family protein [Chitinophagales bacterium]|nr:sodium:solute symporter family protein [Chitinophagales bacterium]